jgi:putative component of membrane protein insertase Oxa1/YidC/SpoIIIJ protein YidD
MEILRKINLYLAFPLVGLLWVYQHTLSPDHGPLKIFNPYGYCKFYPTCSEYARMTLLKEGLIGLPKVFKRISSCTPASLGGVDLPN